MNIMIIAFEVTVMTKYDFLVDGIPVCIYPFSNTSDDKELVIYNLVENGIAVFLYPECDADFGVTSLDKNNREPREPELIFAALSCFFLRVRAYPKMTLLVKYHDVMHELVIENETHQITKNIGKCKVLCAKTVKMNDGIEIRAHRVTSFDSALCTVCCDAERFDKERLNLLFRSQDFAGASFAVAASYADKLCVISVGDVTPYQAVAAGVATLSYEGVRLADGAYSLNFNGDDYRMFKSRDDLVFYPSVKYLY